MKKELAKILTLALVNYIDENRPEETMCCSNTDCENIRAALEEGEYDCVEAFIQKKLLKLTEFEKCMLDFAKARDEYEYDSTKVVELNNKVIELTKSYSKKLLALAKKELLSYADESNPAIEAMADLERTFECNPDKLPQWLKNKLAKKHLEGYILGKEDAMRDMNDSLKSRFSSDGAKGPNPPAINVPTWTPPCYYGGPCTNPFKDCINCPRTNMVISPNTASGTSTAVLHGNTSTTDGKEHNPSFTD